MLEFEPLQHFLPKTAVQLQLSLLQPEDLVSLTYALEIVPKVFAILAGSQRVNIVATPVTKEI